MRITNLMTVNNAIQSMNENKTRLEALRNRVTSQKTFDVASDDPARASSSLSLRSNLRTIEGYTETVANTQTWMNATDETLGSFETLGLQAMNLILGALNDTSTPAERDKSYGAELQTIIQQAVDLGNSQINGQALFAGFQVNGKAFGLANAASTILDYNGNLVTPQVVNYSGDQGDMQRSLGPDQSTTMNVRGDQALQGFIENLIVARNAITQDNIHGTGALSLQTALTGVKSASETITQYRSLNGARLRKVDSASSFLDTVKSETMSLLSQKEDANLAEGIALLSVQESTYKAVLEVSQRAISALSLFEYMQ